MVSTSPAGRDSHGLSVVESLPKEYSIANRRIAIVGTGYVGLVTGACLAELGNTVVCLDTDATKIAGLMTGEVPFYEPGLPDLIRANRRAGRLSFSNAVEEGLREANLIFVSVGTPMGADHSADLSAVRAVAGTIGRNLNGPKIVVLKSTVPVTTNEMVADLIAQHAGSEHRVDVVSNPEFLREGSAVEDFMRPDRVVIGTTSNHAEIVMRDLYAPLEAPIVATDLRTSEMIKYAANAFLATKVSYMNEIANICELVGVDVTMVGLGIGLDERIGTAFMSPGIGYGGSCFPKDVRALERMAHNRDYEATLLRTVESVNQAQIERSFVKIEAALGSLEGKSVCVLGLAFKPNTSDVREAPALRLIEYLLRAGAKIEAHDPVAVEDARRHIPEGVTYHSRMYEAIDEADALVLATEWDAYRRLNFTMVRKLMRGDFVFDGRNIFDAVRVRAAGLRYIGVGRVKDPLVREAAYSHAVAE